MIKFLLLIFWLYVVCVETSGSHETKVKNFAINVPLSCFTKVLLIQMPKCAKTPDTWKKVDAAIKECQEDVKLNIIKGATRSLPYALRLFSFEFLSAFSRF